MSKHTAVSVAAAKAAVAASRKTGRIVHPDVAALATGLMTPRKNVRGETLSEQLAVFLWGRSFSDAEVAAEAIAGFITERYTLAVRDGAAEQGGVAMQAALRSIDRVEHLACSASWNERAATPGLFTQFCVEILSVLGVEWEQVT